MSRRSCQNPSNFEACSFVRRLTIYPTLKMVDHSLSAFEVYSVYPRTYLPYARNIVARLVWLGWRQNKQVPSRKRKFFPLRQLYRLWGISSFLSIEHRGSSPPTSQEQVDRVVKLTIHLELVPLFVFVMWCLCRGEGESYILLSPIPILRNVALTLF